MDRQTLTECLASAPAPELLQEIVGNGAPHNILPLLDIELSRITKQLQKINEYRNSLSGHFHTMPPELLAKIFFVYAADNDLLFNLGWTQSILLVCRRWHEIGMRTPELWAHIRIKTTDSDDLTSSGRRDARDVRRIELQRSRAGLAALTVRMDLSHAVADVKRPYTTVFWHTQFLSSLDLRGMNIYIADILKAVAAHPHPALEHLSVSEYRGLFGQHAGRVSLSLDDVLKQCSPRLQRLSGFNASFSWSLISGLREIRVSYAGQYHLHDLTAALARCPRLEILHLHLPQNTISEDTAPAPASLSCLTSLNISAEGNVCRMLLDSLKNVPASTQITISIFNTPTAPVAEDMVSYIGHHRHRLLSSDIQIVSVEDRLQTSITPAAGTISVRRYTIAALLRLNRRCFYLDPTREHPASFLSVSLSASAPLTVGDPHAFILHAARTWSLASATCLDLRMCEFAATNEHWTAVLGAIPTVHTVVLRAGSGFVGTFMRMLRSALHLQGKCTIANIVFDVGGVQHTTTSPIYGLDGDSLSRIRLNMMRVLLYCAEAARAGCALNTFEVVNNFRQQQSSLDLLNVDANFDWGELYQSLRIGFVNNGVLYSASTGPEGVKRDPFGGLPLH